MEYVTKKYQALTEQLNQVLTRSLSTDCPDLIAIGELFTAQVRLKMIQSLMLPSTQSSLSDEDRLLTIGEASRKLGMTKDYLYRHAAQFPFTIHLAPRQLRFSLRGIERYIRQRKVRPSN